MEFRQDLEFLEGIDRVELDEEEKRNCVKGKSFKCNFCQKVLSSKQNLKEHLFTHTGELPYVCRFSGCGIRFRQGSVLSSHKRIHNAIEKFVTYDRVLCFKLSEHIFDQKEIFEVKRNEEDAISLPPIGKVQEYFIQVRNTDF